MAMQRLGLRDVLTLLLGGASGIGGRGAGFLDGLLRTSGIDKDRIAGTEANEYPASSMTVRIAPGPKKFDNNMAMNWRVADNASMMQTLDEHNKALQKFIKPGMTPAELKVAIEKGKKAEQKLEKFWADKTPRVQYNPHSSAIECIRLDSKENRVQVKWRNGNKWYDFKGHPNSFDASMAFHTLIMQNSLGRTLMPADIAEKAKNNKKKPWQAGVNYNWWNHNNYDPAKANG